MPKNKEKKSKSSPGGEACEHCNCADQPTDGAEATPIDEYSPEGYEAVIAQRDDFCGKYQRALADYQNAQRRFTGIGTLAYP